jgi:hypothetical protein
MLMRGDYIAITWRNELPLAKASGPTMSSPLRMYETVFPNNIDSSDDFCTP